MIIFISIFCINQGTGVGGGDSFYNSNCAQHWMYYEQYGKHQYDISRVHQLALRFGEAFICFTEFIVLAHQGVVTPNLLSVGVKDVPYSAMKF